jgi:hypothetical protein
MNENNRKIIIFSTLGLIWVTSILLIMAPNIGLSTPVFPRTQPNYELFTMLVSGLLLAGYSFITGIQYIRPN